MADDRAQTAPTLPAMPSPRLVRRRILVVEDEAVLAGALARLLERAHEVVLACDGADALRQIDRSGELDLVLSDVHMPWMNGIDLHRALAARRAPIASRFLLMTGAPLSEAHRAYVERAALTVLAKPFPMHELERLIAELPEPVEQPLPRRKIG